MSDPNAGLTPEKQSRTATYAYAVGKSDSAVLDPVPMALYIGTGGDLSVTMLGGVDVVFPDVPDGSIMMIRVTKIKEATECSGIVAMC